MRIFRFWYVAVPWLLMVATLHYFHRSQNVTFSDSERYNAAALWWRCLQAEFLVAALILLYAGMGHFAKPRFYGSIEFAAVTIGVMVPTLGTILTMIR